MHHKINAENTNSNTEKCSPGCPAYFHTVTTIPESHVTTSPMTTLHEHFFFRLRHLCDGLLYRIALIADCLLNSVHWTIHTNLKQNYRYIIGNNNYKYYKSYAKSDMYLQKSNYSVSSQSMHIMWFSLLCACHV